MANRRRGLARLNNAAPGQPLQPAPFVRIYPHGTSRLALHAAWDMSGHINAIHYDVGHGGFDGHSQMHGLAPQDSDRLATPDDRPGEESMTGFRTWDPTFDNRMCEALFPFPAQVNFFQIDGHRLAELGYLRARGMQIMNVAQLSPIDINSFQNHPMRFFEPRWAFKGMADDFNTQLRMGPAYSIFEYMISDLMEYHTNGIELCATIRDILCDVVNVASPYISRNTRVMFYFQGEWPAQDIGHIGKPWFYFNRKAWTIGQAYDTPETIIEQFAATLNDFMESDHFQCFQFYRVFICCLTSLNLLGGGGTLSLMPTEMIKIRESKDYKGRRGYVAISNDDLLCGLYAFMAGFANVCARIKKAYKVLNARVPDICNKLNKFGTKIKTESKSAKQIQSELLLEMTSSIGWQQGTPLTPAILCRITNHVREKYEVDIGLLIFDAIYPLRNIIISWDPKGKIPTEKICLIYWKYGDPEDMGHYDCIYATNLVSWIQKGVTNRQNLVFCYRTLRLVRNNETTEKGELCMNCGFYRKEIELKLGDWDTHGYVQFIYSIACEDCGIKFKSLACYKLHRQRPHGLSKTACESRRVCILCKRIHGNEYDCTSFFCHTCKKKLPSKEKKDHICYIQNSSTKFQKKVEHVVYADCEGSRMSGHHQAICVAATWDELCKEHRKYLSKRCEVCKLGNQCFGTFCNGCMDEHGITNCPDCYKRKSKFFMDENPVDTFLLWLDKKFKKVTVVFHNGGRYDMHLIYGILLQSGRYYIKKEAERGTQIIFMVASLLTEERRKKTTEIRFIDSFNFIPSSLRNFSNMFNIDKKLLTKGRFPYELLNKPDWKDYKGECPEPNMFGITELELKSMDRLSKNRSREIKEILDYISEQKESKEEWVAKERIREYTLLDVYVLHAGCEDFRRNFWSVGKTDPFHWVTLAAAVAGTYRQPMYMPEDSIQVFGMETRSWQREGLRGGRCEPFKLYWKASHEDEEIKLYDVNSEYPAAQMYAHLPLGKVSLDKTYSPPQDIKTFLSTCKFNVLAALLDPTGAHGNGMIECYVKSAFTPFPLLPYRNTKQMKNMYSIHDGIWHGFICVLAEAIHQNQVIVTHIKRIQFWENTTDALFKDFIGSLYAKKVECTGWKKILNMESPDEDSTDEFVAESAKRGININTDNVQENPGLRNTAKLMANCGWGYMCQKPHATDILYFDNDSVDEVGKMAELLTNLETPEDPRRLMNFPQAVGNHTRLKLTKDPLEITKKEMNSNIAYHVGGVAPAWGLQLLTRTILSLHPTQPVYCDTDSVYFVYDKKKIEKGIYKDIPKGCYLGDFVDEYPAYRIVEFVSIGCKSYFMKMIHRKTGAIEYMGKFKGLPMLSSIHSLLDQEGKIAAFGMEQMKAILFSAYHSKDNEGDEKVQSMTMKFNYTNFFKRGQDMKIREANESKTIQFTFDKRQVLWPETGTPETWKEINTAPFCDSEIPLTGEDVQLFWKNLSK